MNVIVLGEDIVMNFAYVILLNVVKGEKVVNVGPVVLQSNVHVILDNLNVILYYAIVYFLY